MLCNISYLTHQILIYANYIIIKISFLDQTFLKLFIGEDKQSFLNFGITSDISSN